METKMIIRGERDRGAAVIVLLLLGTMLLAVALVLALAWPGAQVERPVATAGDSLAGYYAARATAAAPEATLAVVEMEGYRETVAAEREFT
ncbi:MAG: hypothetical protein RRC07_14355 [Anaerolineae bacterium]|nr:hypothetical protein [Anaerolineae bacterium]